MQTKDIQLQLKSIAEAGEFEGFAAVYNERDLQDDIILKGAFTKAINEQPRDGYPLLWSHKQDTPIGVARIEDSSRALVVKGRIDRADPDGEVAFQRAKKGVVKGVSIGFTVPNPAAVKYTEGVRYLSEIRLHELSLVAVPAQPGAQIVSVKHLGDAVRLLRQTTDPDADAVAELKLLEAEVKRLLAADPAKQTDTALLTELQKLAADLRPAA